VASPYSALGIGSGHARLYLPIHALDMATQKLASYVTSDSKSYYLPIVPVGAAL